MSVQRKTKRSKAKGYIPKKQADSMIGKASGGRVAVLLCLFAVAVGVFMVVGAQAGKRNPSLTELEARETDLFSRNESVGEKPSEEYGALPSNDGNASSIVYESSESSEALRCPFELPQPHASVSYQRGVNTEVWHTQAKSNCQDYARELLYGLRDAGTTLAEAGYLDLSGNAWGCVAHSDSTGILTITIENVFASVGPVSPFATNYSLPNAVTCNVMVVRTIVPEMTL